MIHFTVLDKDQHTSESIGWCRMPVSALCINQGVHGWFELYENEMNKNAGSLHLKTTFIDEAYHAEIEKL